MVNPDDLVPSTERDVLANFEEGTLRKEAKDGVVKRRLFRPDKIERKIEEVFLPILIIPGVASSGLFVEKSALDKKYEGLRLWVNPGFLAKARLQNKVFNEDEINDDEERLRGSTLAQAEDELAIKNAWIYHIGLDKNMIDEKPGNRVRPYEGLFGCEYLVDNAIEKISGKLMAPLVDYCVKVMGYEREKNVDAMPYDWRLAPSVNEKRDGYLTKMIERIERMYRENDNLPVVLVCHSMGAKMGHYFLNFAKKEKGQEWLDKYVHTYMPVGAPHGGVGCAVRTGVTGKGLNDTVDTLVGNVSDGLQMYRTWSCGNWLMPRMLPKGVFPTCIVRREGELGLTLTSEIEVSKLFRNRDKPPKELRLKVVYRNRIYAYSDYQPVIHKTSEDSRESMTVYFNKTFYIAVPYLGQNDALGEIVFYLEEPAGRINQNRSLFGKRVQKATAWARCFKKELSKCIRSFAKYWGTTLNVAVSPKPLKLRISDFNGDGTKTLVNGKYILEKEVPIVGCIGGNPMEMLRAKQSIGSISLKMSYSHPPKPTGTKISATPIAMINEDTPNPPIRSNPNKMNTISFDRVAYDVMNGTDVFKADGFVDNMFHLVEKVYEGDPLGPTKESSLDAPPVKCVRSIYGINIQTEAGAIYRKVPVVTIGDNEADRRYMLDTSAKFGGFRPTAKLLSNGDDVWAKLNLLTYKIDGGIVYETPLTLQDIPGETEQRRVCGDGTVPYWNMVHALSWKDEIDVITVDELEGASHQGIVEDERFFALLKRYCKVIDPRANAMMMMKQEINKAGKGITAIAQSVDNFSSFSPDGKNQI